MKIPLLKIIIVLSIFPFFINGQIDSGYVQVKKCKLFYKIWGEGKPIVFLNGGPGISSTHYHNYANFLSVNHKVILFDQRGTGKSKVNRKTTKIHLKEMVQDLDALRTHLGIEKWIVFGHSFGGSYAKEYVIRYGNKVEKLILSATPYELSRSQEFRAIDGSSLTLFELQLLYNHQEEEKKKNPSKDRLAKLERALRARYYVSNPENYEKISKWFLRVNIPSFLLYNGGKHNKKSDLKKIDQPVLIIHGLSDFIDLSNPLIHHELFPNSTLKIIEDSGHIMLLDQPKKYISYIRDFLDKKKP